LELERSPHVHARRLDAFSLAGTELRSEKLIEGFLFATLFLELALILFDYVGHPERHSFAFDSNYLKLPTDVRRFCTT
jgi:hypothetical protein